MPLEVTELPLLCPFSRAELGGLFPLPMVYFSGTGIAGSVPAGWGRQAGKSWLASGPLRAAPWAVEMGSQEGSDEYVWYKAGFQTLVADLPLV